MEKKYYKQTNMGGTHYFLVIDSGVTHVNHLGDNRGYLINSLDREGFEATILGIYDGAYEEISQEDFETALKKAIFELNLYSFIKTN